MECKDALKAALGKRAFPDYEAESGVWVKAKRDSKTCEWKMVSWG